MVAIFRFRYDGSAANTVAKMFERECDIIATQVTLKHFKQTHELISLILEVKKHIISS